MSRVEPAVKKVVSIVGLPDSNLRTLNLLRILSLVAVVCVRYMSNVTLMILRLYIDGICTPSTDALNYRLLISSR